MPGESCLTNICEFCHPVPCFVVPFWLKARLSGFVTELLSWAAVLDRQVDQDTAKNIPQMSVTLQGGKMMGHINSSPLNIWITFLNTHLVRKGLE